MSDAQPPDAERAELKARIAAAAQAMYVGLAFTLGLGVLAVVKRGLVLTPTVVTILLGATGIGIWLVVRIAGSVKEAKPWALWVIAFWYPLGVLSRLSMAAIAQDPIRLGYAAVNACVSVMAIRGLLAMLRLQKLEKGDGPPVLSHPLPPPPGPPPVPPAPVRSEDDEETDDG